MTRRTRLAAQASSYARTPLRGDASGELFLNYMIHAGQPHPFDLLVVRLDLGLTDEEIVVHVREVLERQVGQALAQVRRGQA